ncbi:hypothetical protein COPEUT_02142 [Coprococcus eutactus ATCC 27759]|nr:hypothetical protein COPEUT_02142 [Coprococcus eutactus ATCC 27759]
MIPQNCAKYFAGFYIDFKFTQILHTHISHFTCPFYNGFW